MPLKRCQSDGKPGWKWGDAGKCYTGQNARKKALAQAVAMGEFRKSDDNGDGKMNIFSRIIDSVKNITKEDLSAELVDVHTEMARLLKRALVIMESMDGEELPSLPIFELLSLDGLTDKGETEEDVVEEPKHFLGRGSTNPVVVFVGASPSKIDKIRNRPFSGIVGQTLEDLYVKNVGLTLDQVYFTNLVKDYCENENGKAAEPTDEQVRNSWDDFVAEITELNPRYVVALGKTAHKYLKAVAEEWVPHPRAVNVRGNSGEVERKMHRLAKKINTPNEIISGTVIKGSDEKQIVYGVVMEPMENDTDLNWSSKGEIEEAAHYFMRNFRLIDTQHSRVDIDAVPVESWIQHEDTTIGGVPVKGGSWIMGVKVEDKNEWDRVKSGEYSGFSIDAFARIDPNLLLLDS